MIWLHWLTAAALLGLFVIGLIMTRLDFNAPLKQPLFRLHAVLGYAVLIMTVLRLYFKFRTPQPAPPEGMSGPRLLLYKAVHALLYLFILVMVVTGVGILTQSGLGLSPFFDIRGLNFEVRAVGSHLTFKFVLAALVLIHVVGVFSYQATKGDVLSRMGLGKGD
jgi:cytochrome b561